MKTNIETTSADISTAKILVVGDVMLDQYWHGGSTRLSPEAPVPVVKINKTDNRPGGAANVANNLVSLGCQLKLLGVIGQDAAADILEQALDMHKISYQFIKLKEFSTIIKLRVLCRHQQMIRLDHEDEPGTISSEQIKLLYDLYASELSNYQAVILSDYAKGIFTDPQPFIKAAKALGIPVAVDPKNRNFEVYRGAQIVKPNMAEFQAIVGKCSTDEMIEEKARNLLRDHGIESLVVTRGAQGITVVQASKPAVHLPACGGEVYDVTGAGDTVIAVVTAGLASGMDLIKAVHLATVAAGLVVAKVGTSNVTLQELKQAMDKPKELPLGVTDENTLQKIIKQSQARGEKIVFVNGCYDFLHYGHTRYLDQARALGDRLIVGVNSDESIKRLKGDSRPHYNLQYRMEVLAALKSVDWVVSFTEDTPGRLVEALSPDIIAKGNENFATIADIPATEGVEHVLRNGGAVHLIGRTPDCSSTKMIEFMEETEK
jgi:D-beta-D-heptose 7-phosphate kinase/D-beta-D-heptose 1-phosphate adenosyltransferase